MNGRTAGPVGEADGSKVITGQVDDFIVSDSCDSNDLRSRRVDELVARRMRELPPGSTVTEQEVREAVVREVIEEVGAKPALGVLRPYRDPDLLDAVSAFIRRFVACPEDARVAMTLWVVHTHAFDAADCSPRLALLSAEPQSGKTRCLEVVKLLANNPLFTANISPAALFRKIAADPVTILFDEIDAIFGPKARGDHEDLRALLNAGYERGAVVVRCVGDSAKFDAKDFEVFAPVALAGLGRLPETVEQRSIVIRLKRRAPGEVVEKLRRRQIGPEAEAMRERIARWTAEHVHVLSNMEPEIPDDLSDRAGDVWEPLLAIADLAGDPWPERARAAAVALYGAREADESTIGVRLLSDINVVFDATNGMSSGDLAARLASIEGAPWHAWGRDSKPLTAHALAVLLRRYEIKPRQHRLGESTFRGYVRGDFEDAFARYLPTPPVPPPTRVQHRNKCNTPSPVTATDVALGHLLHSPEDEDDLGAWTSDRPEDYAEVVA